MPHITLAKVLRSIVLVAIVIPISFVTCSAQEADRDEFVNEFLDDFANLQAALVKIRIEGDDIVYRTSEFVPNDDEEERRVVVMRRQPFTVEVPRTELVDGEIQTRMVTVSRQRYVPVEQTARGKYRIVDVPIDREIRFQSLAGEEIAHQAVRQMLTMREVYVVLIPSYYEVPEIWSDVLKEETLLLRIDASLKNQPYLTLPVTR